MTDKGPQTPAELVDFARLTAQARGKPLLKEQIETLDLVIAQRCSSMRAGLSAYSQASFDLDYWGRQTYVLESLLYFLQRIDNDPEARSYLVKRLRREVIRNAEVDEGDGQQAP